jgi:predicted DNA-binding protein
MANTNVSIRPPAELLKKVDEEAKRRRRSRNFIVTEIIEQHFEQPIYSNGKQPTKKAGAR